MLLGNKPVIAKGEFFKSENKLASSIETIHKNPDFGFECLHYSVSESSESLKVTILNKKK